MGRERKKDRLGEERYNNQNCLSIIIEYINSSNITVEFQDKYKARVKSQYHHFIDGTIQNPYYPTVYGVGITGCKYPTGIDGKHVKEYRAWCDMLRRCFDNKYKNERQTYKDVTCCNEWLYYEIFYEWLHEQENFDKWLNNAQWSLDKDILIKGNKIYSPETCCLVPQNVNKLFIKSDASRNGFPIGISLRGKVFVVICCNPFTNKQEKFGSYSTIEDAFYLGYKPYKENIIKQVAQEEYDKGNITKKCYEAMMNYQAEITD